MALFLPPLGWDGDLRAPTTDEQNEGFPCGPADRALFNRLINGIHAELGAVLSEAGITSAEGDDTTLLQAILALIEAATGGGDTSAYVTMTQARARLPIFPEVQHADGHLNITSPSTGQVRVPAGRTFLHRGIFPTTTVQTDLATTLSKTYHLRWNPTDGFALKDLSDSGYNPSALAETNVAFDSTFDDMLVARVVTNSSNVPTVDNLINRTRLVHNSLWRGVLGPFLDWTTKASTGVGLSWARTPMFANPFTLAGWRSNDSGPDGDPTEPNAGTARALEIRVNPSAPVTRYSIPDFQFNYEDTQLNQGMAEVNIMAIAV
jgi:hypothetical protein